MSDSAVKRKLHNLRTAYAREKYVIEKRRSMNERPSRVKRWCHYERLRFLDEVFSPKVWVLQVSLLIELFFCRELLLDYCTSVLVSLILQMYLRCLATDKSFKMSTVKLRYNGLTYNVSLVIAYASSWSRLPTLFHTKYVG